MYVAMRNASTYYKDYFGLYPFSNPNGPFGGLPNTSMCKASAKSACKIGGVLTYFFDCVEEVPNYSDCLTNSTIAHQGSIQNCTNTHAAAVSQINPNGDGAEVTAASLAAQNAYNECTDKANAAHDEAMTKCTIDFFF